MTAEPAAVGAVPAVSIAVPVFNGAATLGAALETLRRQSFADWEALILDNASTDGTAAIARDFAARDARFRYARQPRNVGQLANFFDALAAARSPLFLWRAHDDLADPHWLEALVALLAERPDAALAVGTVETRESDGAFTRATAFPTLHGDRRAADRVRLLFASHPSWIYGLFRLDALRARVEVVRTRYGHPWAWDHLTLLPFLLDGAVAGTRNARFLQTMVRPSGAGPRARPRAALMARLRRAFLAIALDDVAARFRGSAASFWRALIWLYVGKRVYRARRVWWRAITERLGGAPPGGAETAGFEKYF